MSSSKKSKVSASCDLYSREIPRGSRDEFCISVCFCMVIFTSLSDFLFFILPFSLLRGEDCLWGNRE